MSVNDQHFAYPDAAPNLSTKEKARLNKKFDELLERLRATCKHLIKSDGTPIKRKRGSRHAFKQYLDKTEASVNDDDESDATDDE